MSQASTVFESGFRSLVEVSRRRADTDPERILYTFLVDGGLAAESLTHCGLDRRARALAAVLQDAGVAGERALLLFPAGLEFIGAFFGCLYAGVVAVPCYPPKLNRPQPRLRAIAADADARVVLTTAALNARRETICEQAPELRHALWVAAEDLDPTAADSWRDPGVDGESLAFLQYTSGSTSLPKGVMVTHGNLLHNQEMIRQAFGQSAASVIVGWLPLYHDMGLIGNVLQPLYVGARCVLMSPLAFLQRPMRWLEAVSHWRGTTSGGPNFAYELCLRKAAAAAGEPLDLSSWRVAFNGAEPVRAETQERFARTFAAAGFRPAAFYPCYGLAEATLFVTGGEAGESPAIVPFDAGELERHRAVEVPPAAAAARRLVDCGRVWGNQEALVVDPETDRERAPGEVGEIWVRGASVAAGYWRRPEETRLAFHATLADGGGPFLRTGDLGLSHGGRLFVTGRLKELIILRGRNLYPQDLERTAEQSHPALRPGCGAAFPVEVDGEERLVLAHEVERHPGVGLAEVASAVRRAVAEEHEVQAHDVVLLRAGTLLKTSSGKIQRRACAALYRDGGLEELGRFPALSTELAETDLEEAVPELDREGAGALESALRRLAAQALRVPAGRIDPAAPLTGLGLDSLAAVELSHQIERQLGAVVPMGLLLEGVSLGELARRLAGELAGGTAAAPIPAHGEEDLALSEGQRALLFAERLAPSAATYNVAVAARVRGEVDVEALRRALQTLVDRHPALRTAIDPADGEPRRRVRQRLQADFHVEAVAWNGAPPLDRITAEAYRPFDLERDPLLRGRLFTETGGPGKALLLVAHHLVVDFWSLSLLARELAAAYARERGNGAALPAAPAGAAVRYGDYVRWQRERLAGPAGERHWEHWRRRLAGSLPALDLPTDRPRPAAQGFCGAAVSRRWGGELLGGLRAISRSRGATLFSPLLALFQTLLQRHSGQDDLIVGSPAAGRVHPDLANVVGYFVNSLPLRESLADDPAFAGLVERNRSEILAALEHQEYPLPWLARRLQPQRDPSRAPLFQALFVLQSAVLPGEQDLAVFALGEDGARLRLGGLDLESLALPERRAPFDLTLMVAADGEDRLALSLQYDTALFDAATVERMMARLEILAAAAAAHPERRLSELPVLAAGEREQVLTGWNPPDIGPLDGLCLHDLFAARAAAAPGSTALIARGETLTCRELQERANRIAHHLRRLGVGPETRVGVLLERSADLVATLLGVLKAGGAYVPLDPAYPRERLDYLLADSGAAVLVTCAPLRGLLSHPAAQTVLFEAAPLAAESGEDPGAWSVPGNLAYLIYTSGSTGRPKAVAVEHRSAVARMEWARRTFAPEELAGVLAATSICFDLSVFEIFAPLSWGGAVVLAADVLELPRLAAAGRVTLLNTVPSVAAELVRAGGLPAALRTVCLAGEPLKAALARQVLRQPPVRRLLNLYGPSEDTTYSTQSEVDAAEAEAPTIGRPLPGTRAYLLDRRMQPVPPGTPGELHLAGAGLSRGYLGRPELTAEKFVPDPFSPGPGGRLYRTGDLARHRPDGRLDFLGRLDFQVKVRGFRVELGEVEAALERQAGVREAVVLAREDVPGDHRLVAYLGCGPDAPGAAELRARLAAALPAWAVPSAFVVLESLPRTPTGKVDRGALPAPGRDGQAAMAAPVGPIEELLAGLWSELLGGAAVGRGDDFFALGGHSLLAMQVAGRIRRALGVDLPLRSLMERPVLADLAAEVERAGGGGHRDVSGPAALAAGEVPPLSFVQERLWFLDQMEGGSPQYNMPAVVRLEGLLAAGALAAALGEVVRRHQALRSTFQAGPDGPRVAVAAAAPFRLPEIDLSALPTARRDAEAGRIARAEARLAFDLRRAPLLRALLLRLGEGERRAVLVLHHAAGDGWSLRLLFREVTALYGAGMTGVPSPLPAPALQYGDWAAWQRRLLRGELLEGELGYWRQRLAGIPAGLDLPADRPRPLAQSFRGAVCEARWPASVAAGLAALARAEGGTLFMAAFAGLASLLARYTGATDLCVGTPVSTRDHVETEAVIGPFINNLVLRCDLAADPPFRDLLRRAREEVLLAHQHRWLPFERLVEELQPARDLSRPPIFQVMLGVEPAPLEPLRAGGVAFTPERVDNGSAKLDWTLTLESGPASLEAALEYSSDLFDAATAARALSHLGTLLAGVLADPAAPLSRLPLLSAAERDQLLAMGEGAAREVPPVAVHELFMLQARLTPERVAVVAGGGSLTYAELARRAAALARELRGLGVGAETPVALCLERSAGMVVAVLAVLAAGGCYVPLDPAHPRERLALVLEDARPLLLLSQSALLPALPASAARILCLDEFCLDGPGLDARPAGLGGPRVSAASLAYRIYTSGSTGRPKGVDLSHGGVVNFLISMREILGMEAADVLVAVTTLAFDIAVLELLLPLTVGARVVLATREEATEPERLAELLASHQATFLQATPATWRLLVESGWSGDPGLTMLCGGEALPAALSGQMARRGRRLWNLYGPTETTVWSAALSLTGGEAPVPIGGPIANTEIRVLDAGLAPAPVGVPGELYIGGGGLARGYAGRPDLTAERFLPDPLAAAGRPGARLYRTGDVVRFRLDGRLEFLGRVDHQVKIRGFRIELAEIEAALRAIPGVADAVVVARGDGGEARLDGYYVLATAPAAASRPTAAGLRARLAERLPAYMLPTFLVELPALPLTPSGKVDRLRLPPPAGGEAETAAGPAGGELEELLAGLWASVLGRERVGPEQSFFDLGGHSLLATRLVSRLRQVWGTEIPLRLLFEAPSAAAMARRLRSLAGEPPAPPLVPTSREEPAPLSFAQERVYFLSQLDPGSTAYNIAGAVRLVGALDVPALELSLQHIVARHDVLRTTLGPVVAGGPAVQRVAPASPRRLPLIDLARLPEGEREACLLHLALEEAERPFDLARGPLLRSTLARLGPESHALFLTLHHAIADGWSLGLLMDEVRSHYHALSRRRHPGLPPLPVQYADFARWQRAWLGDGVQERQLAYWRDELDGAPALLALPTDRPRPQEQTFVGAVCRRPLAAGLGEQAAAFGRREGTTLFMVLMSAFGALLGWWTGQDDLVIGTDVANRNRIETEPLIGFFVNQLPLRLRLAGDPSFRRLAARTREAALAAYTHQDLPFEKLVEVLRSKRSLSYAPVFQVKLNVHNVPARSLELPGLDVSKLDVPRRAAQLDLIVNMETENGLGMAVEYNVDLFQASTIERLAGHFESVLATALARPEVRLGELKSQLDQDERSLAARVQQGSREDLGRKLKGIPRRSGGVVLAGVAIEPAEPVEQGG